MSVKISSKLISHEKEIVGGKDVDVPLQVIRSRISMFTVRTKGTDVAGGVMDEAVSFHFVFALEAFAAFAALAAFDGAVVWSLRGVDVHVGPEGN